LAAVLAVALLFAATVMALRAFDTGDEVLCSDETEVAALIAQDPDATCFDGSEGRRVASVALGFACAGLALGAALTAIWIAFTGGASRYLMPATAGALLLGAASIVLTSV
jgi:hypothetical protein